MKTSLFCLCLSLIPGLFGAFSAQAALSIECGKLNADLSALEIPGVQFSAADDLFSGVCGKNWDMAIGKKNSWLGSRPEGRNITARPYSGRNGKSVKITWLKTQGPSPTGRVFTLKYLYQDNPVLTITKLGGLDNGKVIATLKCVGSYD